MWQYHKTSMDHSKIIDTFETYQGRRRCLAVGEQLPVAGGRGGSCPPVEKKAGAVPCPPWRGQGWGLNRSGVRIALTEETKNKQPMPPVSNTVQKN